MITSANSPASPSTSHGDASRAANSGGSSAPTARSPHSGASAPPGWGGKLKFSSLARPRMRPFSGPAASSHVHSSMTSSSPPTTAAAAPSPVRQWRKRCRAASVTSKMVMATSGRPKMIRYCTSRVGRIRNGRRNGAPACERKPR